MSGSTAMLSHRRVGLAALLAGMTSVVAASSFAWASERATTVFLVSNSGHDISHAKCVAMHGCGPEVTAPIILKSGMVYTIKVQGTISPWGMRKYRCGHTEANAEYPTTGVSTPTTDDAQFRFATPGIYGYCSKLPVKTDWFQINLGNGWIHPIADGHPSKPSGNIGVDQHPYTFTVVGDGKAPIFRYIDYHPSDNEGKFRIQITTP